MILVINTQSKTDPLVNKLVEDTKNKCGDAPIFFNEGFQVENIRLALVYHRDVEIVNQLNNCGILVIQHGQGFDVNYKKNTFRTTDLYRSLSSISHLITNNNNITSEVIKSLLYASYDNQKIPCPLRKYGTQELICGKCGFILADNNGVHYFKRFLIEVKGIGETPPCLLTDVRYT